MPFDNLREFITAVEARGELLHVKEKVSPILEITEWADRTVKSSYAANATGGGHATTEDLKRIADGWRAWAADPDGWFAVINGEILCRKDR